MTEAIIVALIGGAVTLVGIIATTSASRNQLQNDMKTHQALIEQELSHIKDDIKEHNGYAKMFQESLPVVNEKIKVINKRLADLEEINKIKGE